MAIEVLDNAVAAEDWDAYVLGQSDAVFAQQYHWLTLVRETYGGQAHYLSAYEGGRLVGVLPLMRRCIMGQSVLISTPFTDVAGPLTDAAPVREALAEEAVSLGRREGVSHVELRDRERLEQAELCDRSRAVLCLPLPDSVPALWEALSKNMRKKVRRSQREGLTAEMGGAEHLSAFYRIYSENMRDLGAPMHSPRFFAGLFERFAEQSFSVLIRTAGGEAAGAAVALAFGDTVTVLCAHSLRRYYSLFPNNLLYWTLLEQAISRGARVADFGRSPRGTGIYEFKKLWGMDDRQLYYDILPVSRRPRLQERREGLLYRTFAAVWRRTPLPLARRLGPTLFSRLPI